MVKFLISKKNIDLSDLPFTLIGLPTFVVTHGLGQPEETVPSTKYKR